MKTIMLILASVSMMLTSCQNKGPIDWENMDWDLKQRDEYDHHTK